MLVLLGLGIGQFVGHRGGKKSEVARVAPTARATPTPRPTPVVIRPIVFPSRSPLPSATPRPSASPSASPTPRPTATPRPATPRPDHTRYPVTQAMLAGKSAERPATAAPGTPRPTTKPSVAPAAITEPPKKTPAPRPPAKTAAPVKTAAPAKTAAPVRTATPAPKKSGAGALHAQAAIARKVVRGYLSALIRGDERTAYHHLGGNAGDAGLSLSEETFIDHGAKIADLQAQPDASGVNIQAEIAAKHGLYFATYRVEYRNGRATIVSHDFIKP